MLSFRLLQQADTTVHDNWVITVTSSCNQAVCDSRVVLRVVRKFYLLYHAVSVAFSLISSTRGGIDLPEKLISDN